MLRGGGRGGGRPAAVLVHGVAAAPVLFSPAGASIGRRSPQLPTHGGVGTGAILGDRRWRGEEQGARGAALLLSGAARHGGSAGEGELASARGSERGGAGTTGRGRDQH